MSLLSRLFGGKSEEKTESAPAVEYGGMRIVAEPMKEGAVYRLAARIEAEIDGETKVHHLVRADTLQDREQASSAAVAKAKQVIDEQGKRLFD